LLRFGKKKALEPQGRDTGRTGRYASSSSVFKVCCRFNHCNENLKPLLIMLLKAVSDSGIAHNLIRIR